MVARLTSIVSRKGKANQEAVGSTPTFGFLLLFFLSQFFPFTLCLSRYSTLSNFYF